jgi:hypothetical protein
MYKYQSSEELLFNSKLIELPELKQISDFHNKTIQEVLVKLQPYISVKRNRDKQVKKVWVDFTERYSNVQLKFKMEF